MLKRAILIDGNNLLFRSYFATAYNGNLMKNSKGLPTNALYGYINMINKIINEENPEYIMVAFDKGKNFRSELYTDYKAGRDETPKELKMQFPIAKEITTLMGIKYIEIDNYEADDIIGTFARMADEDKCYNATIISSDKDLLQLISDEVDVKLLKQKDYIWMNPKTFFDTYGIEPIKMIDLKSLMGDPSDNIPGVKGIGEKTALALLQKYGSLDNIYTNIDEIKGKLREKLENDKENAYFSYKLATIYKTIDFEYTFEDIKYNGIMEKELYEKYQELEFNSFLKNINTRKTKIESEYDIVKSKIEINNKKSIYLELDGTNYHTSNIIGASIYDGSRSYYFDLPAILLNKELFASSFVTFDLKKNIVALNKYDIKTNSDFDSLIGAYLLEYNIKDDVAVLASTYNIELEYYENIINKRKVLDEKTIINNIVNKAKFLYDTYEDLTKKLKEKELFELYNSIEHPLIEVLANMEINGILVDTKVLGELKDEIKVKLDLKQNNIYNYAGEEFNIQSPKQLGTILFDKLNISKGRGKSATSTAYEALIKHKGEHPIIDEILEYRNLAKLYNTYLNGFDEYVHEDNKMHTIYKQNVARTGRLSSIEPNLQNIPVRSEEGRKIRKAFIPSKECVLLSSDYSQIELRMLAHISGCQALNKAFIDSEDIHTKVASDIYGVDIDAVTKNMRRTAKAVIFGIVYGISGYGLGENLDVSPYEAKKYIEKYLTLYPGVDKYMKDIVVSAKENGYVKTIFNRIRTIDEINNTNYLIRQSGERIALNTPVQGSSADILKLAMIKLYKELKNNNYKSKMLLQVHDELILEVPNDELESIKLLVKDVMENIYKLSVPLKVEIDYGKNWYEAK